MHYKLIALDLDGTLLNEQSQISEKTRTVIKEVVNSGVAVTIATGRIFQSAEYFAKEMGLNLPLICCDGAMVKESVTGYEHYHSHIDLDLAKAVARFGQTEGIYLRFYINDVMYVERNWEHARRIAEHLRVKAALVPDLAEFLAEEPTLISITETEENFNRAYPLLCNEFADRLTLTKFSASGGRKGVGIINKESSKGKALEVLASHLGVRQEEIMAFGDDLNDMGLLTGAGFAVAMGNADPAVKAVAGYITGTNREDGVAAALEKLVLS
jgi:Cof subfamily protein (haloacid dehalogenase superfamily)